MRLSDLQDFMDFLDTFGYGYSVLASDVTEIAELFIMGKRAGLI